jgi:hypothetical protein
MAPGVDLSYHDSEAAGAAAAWTLLPQPSAWWNERGPAIAMRSRLYLKNTGGGWLC